MVIPYSEIVNQDFQQGAGYVQSLANRVRKAYCQNLQNIDDLENAVGFQYDVFKPARDLVRQYVCELPEDPVPVFPNRPLLPGDPKGCQCDRMFVRYRRVLPSIGFSDVETRYVRGKISLDKRKVGGTLSDPRFDVGIVHYGANAGACLLEPQFTAALQFVPKDGYIELLEVKPDPAYPPPEPCQRSVFPVRQPRSPAPITPPTVNVPNLPGLPDINIPIYLPPIVIPPGISFAPKIDIDLGGINFEFSLGGVDITINPSIEFPINIAPNIALPLLPPVIFPVVSGGGGCNLTPVLSAVKVVQDTVNDVVEITTDIDEGVDALNQLTTETIIPLLKDIQDCACDGESEQVATFGDLQTFTYNSPNRELTFAQVNIVTPTDKAKTFGVPGGVDVAIVGWYAFGRLGRWGARQPLQFVNNLCVPPGDGYFNFTFSVYNGLLADGTVHRRKEP